MSAPKNIQRDGTYADPHKAMVASSASVSASTPGANSDGNVHYDYGSAQHNYATTTVTNTAGNVSCFGVWMTPPRKDRHPYRVKINGHLIGTEEENPRLALVIGYAQDTITGTDLLQDPIYLPIDGGQMDDLIIMEDVLKTNPDYDMPIYFGIAVIGIATAATYFAQISVQNLGVKPPTMQNAIS